MKQIHVIGLLLGLLVSEGVWAQLPTAQQIASKMKIGWNLGNTLEATGGETSWGNPKATQLLIDSVKAAGFNAIRLPVSWDKHANSTTHVIDSIWMARVKAVVDYCINDSLYVFFNIHWDGGWLENHVTTADSASVNAKQKAYWTQISNYFKDYDEHLLFASANEPNASDAKAVSVLLSYHQTFINAVRATGGNNKSRTLIIQGPNTNIELTSSLMNMPTDSIGNRLIVEIHYYSPWNFVGMTEDATWGKMAYYWGKGYHSIVDPAHNVTWGEESDVAKSFDLIKTTFVDKGIPVVVGEFATVARTGIPDLNLHIASREYWYKIVVQNAVNHGCIPFVWDVGGLINRYTGKVSDRGVVNAIKEGTGLYTPAYFTLDATINGTGSTNLSPNLSAYKDGSIVTITAKPGSGFQFDRWSGDLNDTINPTTIVMKANHSVTANFSARFTLETTINGTGSITLSPNLSAYKDGSIVTITAKPGSGFQFDSWSGDLNDTINPTTIVMKANHSVMANFSTKPLAINTMNLIDNVQVYPNPYSSTFTLKFNNPEDVLTIDVFNVIGKKVESFDCQSSPNMVTMGASLHKGLHLLCIHCKEGVKTFKIIKE